MSQKVKVALAAVLALVVAGVIGQVIMSNPPTAKQRPQPPQKARLVEVVTLQPSDYQVQLKAFGRVSSPSTTTLSSQVSGQLLMLADNFIQGGQVEKGQLLLQIDDRDYQNSLTQAEADLAKARSDLATEQAQARQALDDWKALNGNRAPDPLVAREPQLAAASAAVSSAEARVEQARLNLQRTRVHAPFDGIVQSRNVGPGQYINTGSQLATLFATESVEVSLPINNRDLNLLALPPASSPDVELTADFGDFIGSWKGKVVRSSGMIDQQNRQLALIAEVKNPYQIEQANGKRKMPLLVGQFVEANVFGRTLNNVFVVPSASVHQGNKVWLLEDNSLQARQVRLLHSNNGDSVIRGVSAGEQLVISPISPDVISGTLAQSHNAAKGNKQGKNKNQLAEKRSGKKREGSDL